MTTDVQAVREEYEQILMGVRIELQDSEGERRRLLRKTRALEAELSRQRSKAAADNGDREFFDLWISECGKPPTRTIFGEKRQAVIRSARQTMQPHPDGDEVIRNAIRGVGQYRYVVDGRRSKSGIQSQRYDELELILRNEVNIEKFARLLEQAPDEPLPPKPVAETRRHPRGDRFDPVHELAQALGRADCKMRGNPYHHQKWVAQCPAHDDRNPSLSITEVSGKVLLYCYAGCSTASILEALGLDWCDLFSPDFSHQKAVDACGPDPRPNGKPFDQLGIDWGVA